MHKYKNNNKKDTTKKKSITKKKDIVKKKSIVKKLKIEQKGGDFPNSSVTQLSPSAFLNDSYFCVNKNSIKDFILAIEQLKTDMK